MRFPSSRRVDNSDGGGGVGEVMLLTGDDRKRATSISGGFNPSPIISTGGTADTDVADSIRSEYGVNAFSSYDDYAKQSVTASSPYDAYSSGGSGYGTVYSVGGNGGDVLTGNNNGGALFTGPGPKGASEFASKERMSIY